MTFALHWDATALMLALIIFVIVRPLAVLILTWRANESLFHRISLGWLGIRGIGSLNYIAYARVHGPAGSEASRMVDIAITVVTLSVFIHGISVTPLLALRRKREEDQ